MGLQPLEFTDCLTDSPYFRENLHNHEKELERTSQQIKGLIKDLNNVINAAKNLSRCQRVLAESLVNFKFECIGTKMTDEEQVISESLVQFGTLIKSIEDEREKMLTTSQMTILNPLEKFRKEHIGGVKEGKKKFEKQSLKFCQSQERYLNLSTKKQDVLQEADASLEMEQRHFCQASLQYVCLLQQVQEQKKFEFVEPLLSFIYAWLTFYHQGHEIHLDFNHYMKDLQFKIQKTRSNFEATRDQTDALMKRMLELRNANPVDLGICNKMYTREGYLYLMEKKAFGTTSWSKQYCMYKKDTNEVTLIPYNHSGKFNPETFKLKSCIRRITDTIDKRFCFDITSVDKPGVTYTLQALSEEDRKKWMDVMGGKEPEYTTPGKVTKSDERVLDEVGFAFISKCIEALEARGLEEQGLYRVVGVNSKVTKLLEMGLDRRKADKMNWDDSMEWESKTVTSALKSYLRQLKEPLMTFRHHFAFIAAAKQETQKQRINDVHSLVHRLPEANFNMLQLLTRHLLNVSLNADKNLMTVSNLSVCFGPTLLRAEEDTVAAIMDLKFCNVVVEIMIENFNQIFGTKPEHPGPDSDAAQAPAPHAKLPQGNIMTNSYPGPKPRHSAQYLQRTSNKNAPPPVTHAVIKSYYDGPLSASLHSVHQSVGGIVGQPMRADSGVSLRSQSATAASESNLHTMSQSPPNSSPPLHHPPTNSLPLKKNNLYATGDEAKIEHAGLNNTSSSSESMSSVSSRDQFDTVMPAKGRAASGTRLNTHYVTQYKPLNNMHPKITPGGTRAASPSSVNNVRRVRTLYACVGENDGELSFEPNQIITNVRGSLEPGWLEGTLNGKTGLVPENYVEFLP